MVTGLVINEEKPDAPVPGRQVLLFSHQTDHGYLQDKDALGLAEFRAETDSAGRFRVDAVPCNGQFRVRLDDLQLLYRQLDERTRGIVDLDTKGVCGEVLDLGTLLAHVVVFDPVAVEGLLLDELTLEPLPSRRILVDPGKSRYSASYEFETVTGPDGRFRFARVPRKGEFVLRFDDDSILKQAGGDSQFHLVTPPTGEVFDTGPLSAYAGDAQRWAMVCRGEPLTLPPARAGLLVFEQDGGRWQHMRWSPGWNRSWKAILCFERTTKIVGRYAGAGAPRGGGPALRVTLEATIFRLRDGRRFHTKIKADPPAEGNLLGDSGDPYPALEAWLRTLPD